MMEQKAGAQISSKAFIQSLVILFVLMLLAGVLTRLVPAGSYARIDTAERQVIDPDSFQLVQRPDYPVWRWLSAPLEVLWGPDSVIIITIIIFLLMVGSAVAVMDKSGLLKAAVARLVGRFGNRKYVLLLIISFFFMLIGAFFGIFEEVVPLVPLMIALSYLLGWDALVGLGMSVLATNMGFSAAITNPFTIGIAQEIAGLPLFSGAWLRIPIFLAVYAIFAFFLLRYARKIEHDPQSSLIYDEDQAERKKYAAMEIETLLKSGAQLKNAMIWLLVFVILILGVLMSSPFLPVISSIALPLVGLLFFIGGMGAGFLSGVSAKEVWGAAREGLSGIAPAIPLILMAASIKHIVAHGGIMDTILYNASQAFSQASPFAAAVMIYILALFIEFFIGSGSAKAFLMMPILMPLADLVGVTRQVAVLGYCFGDGFSNMVYPTNPVLLISLGLTVVSFPKWIRWTLRLWIWVILLTIIFLGVGVAVNYGPF